MDQPQISGKVFRYLSAMHPSLKRAERKRYQNCEPEQWYPWTEEVAREFTDLMRRSPRDPSFARGFAYVAKESLPEDKYLETTDLLANLGALPSAFQSPAGNGYESRSEGERKMAVAFRGLPGFQNVCIAVLGEIQERMQACGARGIDVKHVQGCRLQGGEVCNFELTWVGETPPKGAERLDLKEILGDVPAAASGAKGGDAPKRAASGKSASPAKAADSKSTGSGAGAAKTATAPVVKATAGAGAGSTAATRPAADENKSDRKKDASRKQKKKLAAERDAAVRDDAKHASKPTTAQASDGKSPAGKSPAGKSSAGGPPAAKGSAARAAAAGGSAVKTSVADKSGTGKSPVVPTPAAAASSKSDAAATSPTATAPTTTAPAASASAAETEPEKKKRRGRWLRSAFGDSSAKPAPAAPAGSTPPPSPPTPAASESGSATGRAPGTAAGALASGHSGASTTHKDSALSAGGSPAGRSSGQAAQDDARRGGAIHGGTARNGDTDPVASTLTEGEATSSVSRAIRQITRDKSESALRVGGGLRENHEEAAAAPEPAGGVDLFDQLRAKLEEAEAQTRRFQEVEARVLELEAELAAVRSDAAAQVAAVRADVEKQVAEKVATQVTSQVAEQVEAVRAEAQEQISAALRQADRGKVEAEEARAQLAALRDSIRQLVDNE